LFVVVGLLFGVVVVVVVAKQKQNRKQNKKIFLGAFSFGVFFKIQTQVTQTGQSQSQSKET